MKIRNLSLIGFMGSGKTTVGSILSKRTGFLFVDIDEVIEWIEGRTVGEIFDTCGEEYFRNLEARIVKKIYNNQNCVFACGGGVIKRKENINVIKKNSFVVYLYVSPPVAYKRLEKEETRPLLRVDDRKKAIETILKERERLYKSCADLIVDTDNKEPEQIADEILQILQNIKGFK
ncbi:MAG: shikimate kinase [Actinobacteria bacterium]|nr:shikimate kinase [Actinomycetota bacterium]